jgi:hypothetical protein
MATTPMLTHGPRLLKHDRQFQTLQRLSATDTHHGLSHSCTTTPTSNIDNDRVKGFGRDVVPAEGVVNDAVRRAPSIEEAATKTRHIMQHLQGGPPQRPGTHRTAAMKVAAPAHRRHGGCGRPCAKSSLPIKEDADAGHCNPQEGRSCHRPPPLFLRWGLS